MLKKLQCLTRMLVSEAALVTAKLLFLQSECDTWLADCTALLPLWSFTEVP